MKRSYEFIILTLILSWVIVGVAILLGLNSVKTPNFIVFATEYMFIPTICAIILQLAHKEKPFRNLNLSFKLNRWFLVAGIVPLIYTFMTIGINLLFPTVSFSTTYEGLLPYLSAGELELVKQQLPQIPSGIFILSQIVQGLFLGYTINTLSALGEEIGWRGYLLKTLKNKKFLTVSLIIGIIWGLWHFPLILLGHNYPQHPTLGVGMMVIFCILLTPMMIYIVKKSKSVLTAAIFHGVNNALGGIAILYIIGGNDITNGITGIAGFIAILLVNIIFYLYDKYITKENIFTKVIGEY